MIVKTTGKNVSITDALGAYAEKKVSKLEKYIIVPEETTARVLIRTYKDRHKCEVTIPTKIGVLRAEAYSQDAYGAIDEAVDKLSGQIRKQKTRIEKRHRTSLTEAVLASIEEEEQKDVDVKTKSVVITPMNLDDAIMSMELSDHNFFAYLDEDTGGVSIVYKRNDGGYGAIETHVGA